MTNEHYLIASYFVVAAACMAVSFAVYTLLRRSFAAMTTVVPGGRLGNLLQRLFFIGIVLPGLAGFLSVTFYSCDKPTYQKIIADRPYLVAKNQEQLSASFSYIVIALLIWGFIAAASFWLQHRNRNQMADRRPQANL